MFKKRGSEPNNQLKYLFRMYLGIQCIQEVGLSEHPCVCRSTMGFKVGFSIQVGSHNRHLSIRIGAGQNKHITWEIISILYAQNVPNFYILRLDLVNAIGLNLGHQFVIDHPVSFMPHEILIALLYHCDCDHKNKRRNGCEWGDWAVNQQLNHAHYQEVKVCYPSELFKQIPEKYTL